MRFFILILFFIGCSVKNLDFKQEDNFLIKALVYENHNNFKKAFSIYEFLYKKTKKKIYLQRAIKNLYFAKEYDKVIQLVKKEKNPTNKMLEYEIFALIAENKLELAKDELFKLKRDKFFYSVMIYLLIKENKLKTAIEYLKSLYALNPSKDNLLKISDFLISIKEFLCPGTAPDIKIKFLSFIICITFKFFIVVVLRPA